MSPVAMFGLVMLTGVLLAILLIVFLLRLCTILRPDPPGVFADVVDDPEPEVERWTWRPVRDQP